MRGLAPGPDLTYRPVRARGARRRGSSVLTLSGDESKLCGLALPSRYLGEGGLCGVDVMILEGLKEDVDLGV